MNKVYCRDCKWFSVDVYPDEEGIPRTQYHSCSAPQNVDNGDYWYGPGVISENPVNLNKYNNCMWFEKKK